MKETNDPQTSFTILDKSLKCSNNVSLINSYLEYIETERNEDTTEKPKNLLKLTTTSPSIGITHTKNDNFTQPIIHQRSYSILIAIDYSRFTSNDSIYATLTEIFDKLNNEHEHYYSLTSENAQIQLSIMLWHPNNNRRIKTPFTMLAHLINCNASTLSELAKTTLKKYTQMKPILQQRHKSDNDEPTVSQTTASTGELDEIYLQEITNTNQQRHQRNPSGKNRQQQRTLKNEPQSAFESLIEHSLKLYNEFDMAPHSNKHLIYITDGLIHATNPMHQLERISPTGLTLSFIHVRSISESSTGFGYTPHHTYMQFLSRITAGFYAKFNETSKKLDTIESNPIVLTQRHNLNLIATDNIITPLASTPNPQTTSDTSSNFYLNSPNTSIIESETPLETEANSPWYIITDKKAQSSLHLNAISLAIDENYSIYKNNPSNSNNTQPNRDQYIDAKCIAKYEMNRDLTEIVQMRSREGFALTRLCRCGASAMTSVYMTRYLSQTCAIIYKLSYSMPHRRKHFIEMWIACNYLNIRSSYQNSCLLQLLKFTVNNIQQADCERHFEYAQNLFNPPECLRNNFTTTSNTNTIKINSLFKIDKLNRLEVNTLAPKSSRNSLSDDLSEYAHTWRKLLSGELSTHNIDQLYNIATIELVMSADSNRHILNKIQFDEAMKCLSQKLSSWCDLTLIDKHHYIKFIQIDSDHDQEPNAFISIRVSVKQQAFVLIEFQSPPSVSPSQLNRLVDTLRERISQQIDAKFISLPQRRGVYEHLERLFFANTTTTNSSHLLHKKLNWTMGEHVANTSVKHAIIDTIIERRLNEGFRLLFHKTNRLIVFYSEIRIENGDGNARYALVAHAIHLNECCDATNNNNLLQIKRSDCESANFATEILAEPLDGLVNDRLESQFNGKTLNELMEEIENSDRRTFLTLQSKHDLVVHSSYQQHLNSLFELNRITQKPDDNHHHVRYSFAFDLVASASNLVSIIYEEVPANLVPTQHHHYQTELTRLFDTNMHTAMRSYQRHPPLNSNANATITQTLKTTIKSKLTSTDLASNCSSIDDNFEFFLCFNGTAHESSSGANLTSSLISLASSSSSSSASRHQPNQHHQHNQSQSNVTHLYIVAYTFIAASQCLVVFILDCDEAHMRSSLTNTSITTKSHVIRRNLFQCSDCSMYQYVEMIERVCSNAYLASIMSYVAQNALEPLVNKATLNLNADSTLTPCSSGVRFVAGESAGDSAGSTIASCQSNASTVTTSNPPPVQLDKSALDKLLSIAATETRIHEVELSDYIRSTCNHVNKLTTASVNHNEENDENEVIEIEKCAHVSASEAKCGFFERKFDEIFDDAHLSRLAGFSDLFMVNVGSVDNHQYNDDNYRRVSENAAELFNFDLSSPQQQQQNQSTNNNNNNNKTKSTPTSNNIIIDNNNSFNEADISSSLRHFNQLIGLHYLIEVSVDSSSSSSTTNVETPTTPAKYNTTITKPSMTTNTNPNIKRFNSFNSLERQQQQQQQRKRSVVYQHRIKFTRFRASCLTDLLANDPTEFQKLQTAINTQKSPIELRVLLILTWYHFDKTISSACAEFTQTTVNASPKKAAAVVSTTSTSSLSPGDVHHTNYHYNSYNYTHNYNYNHHSPCVVKTTLNTSQQTEFNEVNALLEPLVAEIRWTIRDELLQKRDRLTDLAEFNAYIRHINEGIDRCACSTSGRSSSRRLNATCRYSLREVPFHHILNDMKSQLSAPESSAEHFNFIKEFLQLIGKLSGQFYACQMHQLDDYHYYMPCEFTQAQVVQSSRRPSLNSSFSIQRHSSTSASLCTTEPSTQSPTSTTPSNSDKAPFKILLYIIKPPQQQQQSNNFQLYKPTQHNLTIMNEFSLLYPSSFSSHSPNTRDNLLEYHRKFTQQQQQQQQQLSVINNDINNSLKIQIYFNFDQFAFTQSSLIEPICKQFYDKLEALIKAVSLKLMLKDIADSLKWNTCMSLITPNIAEDATTNSQRQKKPSGNTNTTTSNSNSNNSNKLQCDCVWSIRFKLHRMHQRAIQIQHQSSSGTISQGMHRLKEFLVNCNLRIEDAAGDEDIFVYRRANEIYLLKLREISNQSSLESELDNDAIEPLPNIDCELDARRHSYASIPPEETKTSISTIASGGQRYPSGTQVTPMPDYVELNLYGLNEPDDALKADLTRSLQSELDSCLLTRMCHSIEKNTYRTSYTHHSERLHDDDLVMMKLSSDAYHEDELHLPIVFALNRSLRDSLFYHVKHALTTCLKYTMETVQPQQDSLISNQSNCTIELNQTTPTEWVHMSGSAHEFSFMCHKPPVGPLVHDPASMLLTRVFSLNNKTKTSIGRTAASIMLAEVVYNPRGSDVLLSRRIVRSSSQMETTATRVSRAGPTITFRLYCRGENDVEAFREALRACINEALIVFYTDYVTRIDTSSYLTRVCLQPLAPVFHLDSSSESFNLINRMNKTARETKIGALLTHIESIDDFDAFLLNAHKSNSVVVEMSRQEAIEYLREIIPHKCFEYSRILNGVISHRALENSCSVDDMSEGDASVAIYNKTYLRMIYDWLRALHNHQRHAFNAASTTGNLINEHVSAASSASNLPSLSRLNSTVAPMAISAPNVHQLVYRKEMAYHTKYSLLNFVRDLETFLRDNFKFEVHRKFYSFKESLSDAEACSPLSLSFTASDNSTNEELAALFAASFEKSDECLEDFDELTLIEFSALENHLGRNRNVALIFNIDFSQPVPQTPVPTSIKGASISTNSSYNNLTNLSSSASAKTSQRAPAASSSVQNDDAASTQLKRVFIYTIADARRKHMYTYTFTSESKHYELIRTHMDQAGELMTQRHSLVSCVVAHKLGGMIGDHMITDMKSLKQQLLTTSAPSDSNTLKSKVSSSVSVSASGKSPTVSRAFIFPQNNTSGAPVSVPAPPPSPQMSQMGVKQLYVSVGHHLREYDLVASAVNNQIHFYAHYTPIVSTNNAAIDANSLLLNHVMYSKQQQKHCNVNSSSIYGVAFNYQLLELSGIYRHPRRIYDIATSASLLNQPSQQQHHQQSPMNAQQLKSHHHHHSHQNIAEFYKNLIVPVVSSFHFCATPSLFFMNWCDLVRSEAQLASCGFSEANRANFAPAQQQQQQQQQTLIRHHSSNSPGNTWYQKMRAAFLHEYAKVLEAKKFVRLKDERKAGDVSADVLHFIKRTHTNDGIIYVTVSHDEVYVHVRCGFYARYRSASRVLYQEVGQFIASELHVHSSSYDCHLMVLNRNFSQANSSAPSLQILHIWFKILRELSNEFVESRTPLFSVNKMFKIVYEKSDCSVIPHKVGLIFDLIMGSKRKACDRQVRFIPQYTNLENNIAIYSVHSGAGGASGFNSTPISSSPMMNENAAAQYSTNEFSKYLIVKIENSSMKGSLLSASRANTKMTVAGSEVSTSGALLSKTSSSASLTNLSQRDNNTTKAGIMGAPVHDSVIRLVGYFLCIRKEPRCVASGSSSLNEIHTVFTASHLHEAQSRLHGELKLINHVIEESINDYKREIFWDNLSIAIKSEQLQQTNNLINYLTQNNELEYILANSHKVNACELDESIGDMLAKCYVIKSNIISYFTENFAKNHIFIKSECCDYSILLISDCLLSKLKIDLNARSDRLMSTDSDDGFNSFILVKFNNWAKNCELIQVNRLLEGSAKQQQQQQQQQQVNKSLGLELASFREAGEKQSVSYDNLNFVINSLMYLLWESLFSN